MAAPFADRRSRAGLDLKLPPPCDARDDGPSHAPRPCASASPYTEFNLDRERGGRDFALQSERHLSLQRYRNATGDREHPGDAYATDGDYPGVNCTIFQAKAFHLCGTRADGVGAR